MQSTSERRRRPGTRRTTKSPKSIRKGIAVSAGGVVWREREARGQAGNQAGNQAASQAGEVEIVLVQTPARRWSLPKGTPENGEKLDETALREVSEETGLQVALDEKIGVMRYSFGGEEARIDKAVHFWLMQATGGSFEYHDDEHIDVRWVGLGDAMRMVSYRNTATLLEDAAALLDSRVGPAQA